MYLTTGAGLDLLPRPLTTVDPEFREDQLAGQSPVARAVSSVTCHVTWRAMEMQRAIDCFNKKKTICSDCAQKPAIRVGYWSLS